MKNKYPKSLTLKLMKKFVKNGCCKLTFKRVFIAVLKKKIIRFNEVLGGKYGVRYSDCPMCYIYGWSCKGCVYVKLIKDLPIAPCKEIVSYGFKDNYEEWAKQRIKDYQKMINLIKLYDVKTRKFRKA